MQCSAPQYAPDGVKLDVIDADMLGRIDWSQPWLRALAAVGKPVAKRALRGESIYQALNSGLPGALKQEGWQFVPQTELPPGQAYEAFIHQQRRIPTRENLHDLFNGLIWLHWPLLKQQLNAMQAGEIARQGVGAQRGRLRDAITVLDENGGLLVAPQPLCDALRQKRWHDLFVEHRALWAQAQFLPLGHALLEKLQTPRKAITAHVLCVSWQAWGGAAAQLPQADAWLVTQLQNGACNLAAKPYLPIPVLGIPGWCPENQSVSFYDDRLVFRAPRTA